MLRTVQAGAVGTQDEGKSGKGNDYLAGRGKRFFVETTHGCTRPWRRERDVEKIVILKSEGPLHLGNNTCSFYRWGKCGGRGTREGTALSKVSSELLAKLYLESPPEFSLIFDLRL